MCVCVSVFQRLSCSNRWTYEPDFLDSASRVLTNAHRDRQMLSNALPPYYAVNNYGVHGMPKNICNLFFNLLPMGMTLSGCLKRLPKNATLLLCIIARDVRKYYSVNIAM